MTKKKIFVHLIIIILGALIFWLSFSAYKKTETLLTPSSVSVSGYTRQDGTYVNPYHRRPPGGAIHDRPYENTISLYKVIMVVGGGVVLISTAGLILNKKT